MSLESMDSRSSAIIADEPVMKGRPMKFKPATASACILTAVALVMASGCQGWKQFYQQPTAAPMGTLSDPVWQNQERNAEMADFIIYEHEFRDHVEYLNTAGEDHVKQIAARLSSGQDAQVVVERSSMSPRKNTEYHYPVHPNPELDMRRRDIVVRSLVMMGIQDADERVVVAPSFAQGLEGPQAEAAYYRGMRSMNMGSTGGLGGFGGFGGFTFGGGIF